MNIQDRIEGNKQVVETARQAKRRLMQQLVSNNPLERSTIETCIQVINCVQSSAMGFIDILEELQKMQQPKVCKWTKEMELKHKAICRIECNGQVYQRGKGSFCEFCGGKIEIVGLETKI